MKKLWLLLLLALVMVILSGCQGADSTNAATMSDIPVLCDQNEYLLYQNIFYNGIGPQFEGKPWEKRGIFASVYDAFSDRTRYYVWGFLDQTKCCDWQWEFVPDDVKSLPAPGSLIRVSGTFSAGEDALDGYWLTDAKVQTETAYTGETAEVNMYTMSCTLERVQMMNILYRPDSFEGKQFLAYGRIADVGTLEDPYYNGSWQIGFSSEASVPAIGTLVGMGGTVTGGALANCALKKAP